MKLGKMLTGIYNKMHKCNVSEEISNQNERIKNLEAMASWQASQIDIFIESRDPFFSNLRKRLLNQIVPKSNSDIKLIRYGSSNDGGYYLASPLNSSDLLISVGLGDNISFEQDIIKYVKGIVALDHTIDPLSISGSFEHLLLGLAGAEIDGFTTLTNIIAKHSATDYLLKIDIEGDEWDALDKTDLNVLKKFRQIVVEYHGFARPINLIKSAQMLRVLEKMLGEHFVIFTHANNYGDFLFFGDLEVPDIIEVTYLRKGEKFVPSESAEQLKPNIENNPFSRAIGNNWLNTINS